MRFLSTTALIAALGMSLSPGLSTGAHAEMATYELDPEHTTVFFTVDHIGYAKTLGVFTTVSGSFMYDADTRTLGDVTVSIDSASVESFNQARDAHVRKADFLDVRNHPAITFTATGGKASSATTGTVTGDLTILGQSRPVTLAVTLNKAAPYPFGHKREVLGLSMQTSIDRSDFGMTYGVANGLVGDTIAIQIETEAMKME
jgi:polyisoprenoid-binding protein YceI